MRNALTVFVLVGSTLFAGLYVAGQISTVSAGLANLIAR